MSAPLGYARATAKRLRLGRLYYRLTYEPPVGLLRTWYRQGYAHTLGWRAGRRRMERDLDATAAATRPRPAGDGHPVHFMTGRAHWIMTAYCYLSLRHHAGVALHPVIHDDGTLDEPIRRRLCGLFPEARVVAAAEAEAHLDAHLPAARFPVLRATRLESMMIRKLVDVHAGRPGWQLYLDSDMLFFDRPTFLLDWLVRPERPCCMRDLGSAYGYTPELLGEVTGRAVPPRVNAGVCGLNSGAVPWDQVERWCGELRRRQGLSFFLEQAVTAVLMGPDCLYTPAADYRIVADGRQAADPAPAVLKHYTTLSRAYYYHRAWAGWLRPPADRPGTSPAPGPVAPAPARRTVGRELADAALSRLPAERYGESSAAGRLKYRFYHLPRLWLRQGVRYRLAGVLARRRVDAFFRRPGRAYPLRPAGGAPRVVVNYLLGHRHRACGAASVASLATACPGEFGVRVWDDGSLRDATVTQLGQRFPGLEVVRKGEFDRRLEAALPAAAFPVLRRLPHGYPHILKLLLLAGSDDPYAIVMDSDVLAYRRPDDLVRRARAGASLYLGDHCRNYGYPDDALAAAGAGPLPERLNAGLYGLDPRRIDWPAVERLATGLVAAHGFSYLLEQALVAAVVAAQGGEPLDPTYGMAVYPADAADPPTVVHFANVLPLYFIEANRVLLGPTTTA